MTAVTPEPELTDNLVPCEDFVHLPQSFEDWMDGVAAHEEGNTPLLNDHQIEGYVRERARKPLKYPWHAWRQGGGGTEIPDRGSGGGGGPPPEKKKFDTPENPG